MDGVDLCTVPDAEALELAGKLGLTLQEHSDLTYAGASAYVGVRWDSERKAWVATASGQARRNLGRYRGAP